MTLERQNVTPEAQNVTRDNVTPRARALPIGRDVTVSHVTDSPRDVTHGRDSDTPGPEGRGVTITPKQAQKLAQVRVRFGGWLAGMTAEERERFEREAVR